MRKQRTGVIAVAAALVLAGCGGGASDTADTKPTASPSPQQDIAADKAAAQAAILKITDFPAGWTSKTDDDDPESDAADNDIAACLGVSVDELNEESATEVESPDFEDADDHTISSSVEYLASTAEIEAEWVKAADPKVPGCLQSALAIYFDELIKNPKSEEDKLPEGVTLGKAQVGQLSFPTVGDRTLAYRITLPLQTQGVSVKVFVDIVLASKGRAGVEMTFESVFNPIDAAQQQKYTKLVVDRLTRTEDAAAARS